MTSNLRAALALIQREPGSTPEEVARVLGWYLGGGRWNATKAAQLVSGCLVRRGRVVWSADRTGFFPAPRK